MVPSRIKPFIASGLLLTVSIAGAADESSCQAQFQDVVRQINEEFRTGTAACRDNLCWDNAKLRKGELLRRASAQQQNCVKNRPQPNKNNPQAKQAGKQGGSPSDQQARDSGPPTLGRPATGTYDVTKRGFNGETLQYTRNVTLSPTNQNGVYSLTTSDAKFRLSLDRTRNYFATTNAAGQPTKPMKFVAQRASVPDITVYDVYYFQAPQAGAQKRWLLSETWKLR